jgi:hypothetical protein
MTGVTFRETMSGGYHLSSAPGADRPLQFTVRASLPSVLSLLGTPLFDIHGVVDAVGFADHKVLDGTLCIDLFRGRLLVYSFTFDGNDGKRYSFQGKKTLSEGHMLDAMTVLPGGIHDATGALVGRALLRFDLRSDLMKFLRSFRLVRS